MFASQRVDTLKSFLRHLAAGLLANSLGYLIFLGALIAMEVQNLWVATAFSAATAHTTSFLVSRFWVHDKRRHFLVSIRRYVAFAGIVYLFNNLVLQLMVGVLGMRAEIAYLATVAILSFGNFVFQRRWVY